jgi:hypothetical protein
MPLGDARRSLAAILTPDSRDLLVSVSAFLYA